MPILSSKRQVTLPKALCQKLHVEPGDNLEIFEHNGRITIVKLVVGASNGVLSHLKPDKRYSDEESLQDTIERDNAKSKRKRPVV